jgi:RNA polymerase sigma factor (sigma-70 family)
VARGEKSIQNELDQEILDLLSITETYQKGFSLLVKSYQERLYWHIRGMLNTHEDSDEVLQNTFIKVYKGIANFKGQSKLYTWLYRIASNEAISYIKKMKKHQAITLDDPENGMSNSIKADSYVDSENIDRLLQAAIQDLPEKQRQVFLLRYYDEMPYQEISEILETSVGGLKASYHHAAKKIESFIKERM